jgi:hypothetical protein
MGWRLAWAGLADDYAPQDILIACENDVPTTGRMLCAALGDIVSSFSGQHITVEANGNTREHAGIFVSITSQTLVAEPVGPVRRARHEQRIFPGAGT